MLTIALVGWNDRVSSACRVAWSLGADSVCLIDSVHPKARHLQSAKQIRVYEASKVPDDALILEVDGDPIDNHLALLQSATCIAFGGASYHFPKSEHRRLSIPSRRPCLIGDQAIAIALFARMRC
jgi:hypothetical protein